MSAGRRWCSWSPRARDDVELRNGPAPSICMPYLNNMCGGGGLNNAGWGRARGLSKRGQGAKRQWTVVGAEAPFWFIEVFGGGVSGEQCLSDKVLPRKISMILR